MSRQMAKDDFQKLGRMYSILTDPDARAFYDNHGVDGVKTSFDDLSPDEQFDFLLKVRSATQCVVLS